MKSAEWVLGLCLLIFFSAVKSAFGQDKKDITAPQWGPYSKKYAGLSHIADPDLGILFDLTVVTGYYRGKLVVPNQLFVSDFHPWNTSVDLNHIKDDIPGYEQDIAIFTKAIQENSWDKQAGYFGYVMHHPVTKMPTGILKTAAGENYNKGFDGIYPLIAGICRPDQRKAAMERLFSPQHLWTAVGISVVDQSATYFSNNGYWNGAVWFPHQWFAWKTMLDLGEGTKAAKIAKTALDLYKKETDSTYNCYEIFRIQTGHGNGWHQFSGLSSPILNWVAAYFKPGTITTGFNSWITQQKFNKDQPFLQASLISSTAEAEQTLLVCMPSGKKYKILVNNKPMPYKENIPGALEITIPGSEKIEITITSQLL